MHNRQTRPLSTFKLRDYDCILGDRKKISGTYREFIVRGAQMANACQRAVTLKAEVLVRLHK